MKRIISMVIALLIVAFLVWHFFPRKINVPVEPTYKKLLIQFCPREYNRFLFLKIENEEKVLEIHNLLNQLRYRPRHYFDRASISPSVEAMWIFFIDDLDINTFEAEYDTFYTSTHKVTLDRQKIFYSTTMNKLQLLLEECFNSLAIEQSDIFNNSSLHVYVYP